MTELIATVDAIVFDNEAHKYSVSSLPNNFVKNETHFPPNVCPIVISPFSFAATPAIVSPEGPNPVQNETLVKPDTEAYPPTSLPKLSYIPIISPCRFRLYM